MHSAPLPLSHVYGQIQTPLFVSLSSLFLFLSSSLRAILVHPSPVIGRPQASNQLVAHIVDRDNRSPQLKKRHRWAIEL